MQKGQVATPEQREVFRKGQLESWKNRLDWSFADPFLNTEMVISSRNRINKFITFGQFKKFIEDGDSIPALIEKGISKHLLFFMSKFLQGELKHVLKDEVFRLYNEGKSLDEISKYFKITREDITFIRCLFGIKAKGPTFINRKRTEIPLTQRQIEIVCGSLMGDAKKTNSSTVGFGHGDEQKQYLLWKYEEMKSVVSERTVKGDKNIDPRNGKENIGWRFYTKANTDIETIVSEFYPDGKKNPTNEAFEMLSPLSLAVWYQDDGSTDFCFRNISKNENNIQASFVFCTDSFNQDTCERIVKTLDIKFGIKTCLIPSHNKKGFRVKVLPESNETFLNIVRPHTLPMFAYKFDYVQYVKERTNNDPVQVNLAEVIRAPRGTEFESLPMGEKDNWVRKLVSYNRRRGFDSLIGYTDEDAKKDFGSILKFDTSKITSDSSIRSCSTGAGLPTGFCSHYWNVKPKAGKSPREIFENDEWLSEIIRNILQEGRFPAKRKILQKLRLYRGNKAAGSFMPCVAKAIYLKYAGSNSNVLDFCAGYGGRLAGALAVPNVCSYTACDVSLSSVLGIRKMYSLVGEKPATIDNADALEFMKQKRDNQFDFCFTSPPYFNAEEYEEGNQQSSTRFETYSQWFQKWLLPCVKEACRISRLVIINIANTGAYKISNDLRAETKGLGLLKFEHSLNYRGFSGTVRKEPLFGLSRSL